MWCSSDNRRQRVLTVLLLTALANLGLWGFVGQPAIAGGFAFVVLIGAPGLLLVSLILERDDDELLFRDWLVYGTGVGFGIATLVVLCLGLLPGELTQALLLFVFDGMIGVMSLVLWRRAPRQPAASTPAASDSSRRWWMTGVLLIMLLAAGLRLTNLGYSQLQGDEATPLVRAAAFVQDHEDGVFFQPRGPLDMMIPAGVLAMSGASAELVLRLPFAAAAIFVVLAVISLGSVLAGRRAGLIAGLLLALDGFAIAFGRVMHYESVVLLTTTASIMALYKALSLQRATTRHDERLARRYVWIAALLAATGVIAHYDGLIVLPAWAYLLFEMRRGGRSVRQIAGMMLAPVVVTGGIVAAYYLAFFLHPNFGETLQRYSQSLIDDSGLLVNNLLYYVEHTAFYYGAVGFYFLAAVLWAALLFALWRQRGTRWAAPFGVLVFGLPLVLLVSLRLEVASALAPIWVAACGLLLLRTPAMSAGERLLWIWLGIPLFAALFITESPGLHFYIFSPPLALLAGMTVGQLSHLLEKHGPPTMLKRALLAGMFLLAAINTVYLVRFFVSSDEIAMKTKAGQTAPWLWPSRTFENRMLYFGAPYDAGWRAVGALFAEGVLKGSYQTNIDRWLADWYTRGAEYCKEQPDYVIVDTFSRDDFEEQVQAAVAKGYAIDAIVTTGEESRLLIYSQMPAEEITVYDLATVGGRFADAALKTLLPITPWSGPAPLESVGFRFGDSLEITGVRVDPAQRTAGDRDDAVAAGSHVNVTLAWRLLQETNQDYTVFLQLIDENALKAGQRDTMLACNAGPSGTWKAGKAATGYYRVGVSKDAPQGSYALLAGVYDAATMERLPVFDREGQPLGDAALLRELVIK